MVSIFLFAHQDDEYPINARIRYEINCGNDVYCLYLTDGTGRGVPAAIRDAESIKVLTSYGVLRENIVFLRGADAINDGHLMNNTQEAATWVIAFLRPLALTIETIFVPAWEGGHPDHDATHLIGVAAAYSIGAGDRCFEFPLYNAYGTRFFRVMNPLLHTPTIDRELSFSECLISAFQCWRYPSQAKTWLGLFPESLYRWLVIRRERISKIDATWIAKRPHQGPLLYERMFDTSHEAFMKSTQGIRDHILSMHLY